MNPHRETPSEYLARIQREQDRHFASTGIPTSNRDPVGTLRGTLLMSEVGDEIRETRMGR